jgi:hypothetical protein
LQVGSSAGLQQAAPANNPRCCYDPAILKFTPSLWNCHTLGQFREPPATDLQNCRLTKRLPSRALGAANLAWKNVPGRVGAEELIVIGGCVRERIIDTLAISGRSVHKAIEIFLDIDRL